MPQLAGQIRGVVGAPGALYYGVSAGGFIPVGALTPERAQALMPLALYSLLALVQEFLPAMLERGDGAILSAQGASAVRGMPNIAGGFALAAQRNYLQSLHAAMAGKGVYVGASTRRGYQAHPLLRTAGGGKGRLETPWRTCPRSTRTTSPTAVDHARREEPAGSHLPGRPIRPLSTPATSAWGPDAPRGHQ